MSSGDGRIPAKLERRGSRCGGVGSLESLVTLGATGRVKYPRDAFTVRGFEHGAHTIALLKGRSRECRQVTEEYRLNWREASMHGCGKFGNVSYPGGCRVNSDISSLPIR
ncbi:hypothetical protein CEXT_114341 [Caerostris extrusa]|uniref:Uncharacterized protein n=1 Tax=Caerostris extrusa TaxID=172846 RepID=A0AAV4YAY9_CAEEX|nr:hypothetical protein CEXT_114341 [Caerostris extrusa]